MFGEITNSKLLGGWNFKFQKADKLPQDLASAFGNLYGAKFGGKYEPLFYVATQVVNGVNHKLIVKRTRIVNDGKEIKDFAVVDIHIPVGDVRGEKASVLAETDATDFVLRDEIETGVKKAISGYTGLGFKPILELGTQIVRGVNYIFICEARLIYKDVVDPFLVRLSVNNFQDNWIIAEVENL